MRPLGSVFAVAFAATLVAALAFGFYFGYPNWWRGLREGDQSFLQNLLSEGLGALLTAAIIAPLTTFVVERRREARLAPVRAAFVEAVANRFDFLLQELAQVVTLMLLSAETLKAAGTVDRSGEFLHELSRKMQGLPALNKDGSGRVALEVAAIIANLLKSVEGLIAKLEGISRQVALYTPILDHGDIAEAAALVDAIERAKEDLWHLRQYCLGHASSETLIRVETMSSVLSLPTTRLLSLAKTTPDATRVKVQALQARKQFATEQARILRAIRETINPMLYDEAIAERNKLFDNLFGGGGKSGG